MGRVTNNQRRRSNGILIGFKGELKSGKDTAALRLVNEYGFRRYAFADQLKRLCALVPGVKPEQLGWIEAKKSWAGDKDDYGRKLLQDMGDGARKLLGMNVWVNAVDNNIQADGLIPDEDDIVLADVRYPNEAKWIRENGGVVIEIQRPDVERTGEASQHVTETIQREIVPDYVIVNDRGIEDLWDEVDLMMAKLEAAERDLSEEPPLPFKTGFSTYVRNRLN